MITFPHSEEILLTRQRHEADRAGLHYDIRAVLGDKAYSWATKKEMPDPGRAIVLWEQPVHTSHYALSERVEIPKGQYGAGVTTLDWVRKAKISNPENASDKFVLETKDGQRYLFKYTPNFGEKAWLFKALPSVEKQASLIAGALGTHLAQNIATKAALKSKRVSNYLANSFAQGTKGVVDTSLGARAKRFLSGAVVPDIAVAHQKAHEFGSMMKPMIESATKKQQAGLRMLSQGRIGDLQKYKLDKDPIIQGAHAMFSSRVKALPSLDALADKAKGVQSIFKDKTHPLASNILANISKGKVPQGSKFKPGVLDSKAPIAGALSSAVLDPAGGALNSLKTIGSSNSFKNTRIGGKINQMLENKFIKTPIKSGIATGEEPTGKLSKLKNMAYEYGVNPVSAQLKRTSGAVSDVLGI